MPNRRGYVLLEALLGLLVLSVTVTLIAGTARIRTRQEFRIRDDEMRYLWEDDEGIEQLSQISKGNDEQTGGELPLLPIREVLHYLPVYQDPVLLLP